MTTERLDKLVRSALTDEDEIAHGEAMDPSMDEGLGTCAYCDDEWPCRTQRGIDRLLARLDGSASCFYQCIVESGDGSCDVRVEPQP